MARLLLDAHVSGRVIGVALRRSGHDVRALTDERELEGLPDADVLALAARDERILVTHDVKDFVPLLRVWAEAGRTHAGCILVHGIGDEEHGRVIRGVRRLLARHDDWTDLAVVLSPVAGR